jgi:hypothetical protein
MATFIAFLWVMVPYILFRVIAPFIVPLGYDAFYGVLLGFVTFYCVLLGFDAITLCMCLLMFERTPCPPPSVTCNYWTTKNKYSVY